MPLLVEAREAATEPVQPAISKLKAGYVAVALAIQEAAGDMTASNVGQKLSAAVQAAHKGTGGYAYYLDHAGDDSDGDVIYSCSGDTMSCPYEMQDNGDGVAATAKLDMDSARKVSPRVTYEDVNDDDSDGMETMYESWKRDKIYTGESPLFERFVSKAERDQMEEGDFAGKGKSFPINKPGDIMAAVHSMGRAGSGNYGPAALKANIIRIAKKKGWTKYLPKAWQGTDAKEAAKRITGGTLKLTETTVRPSDEALELIESAAGAEMEIKLIAPGKGSSAFYTPESLRQAAADKIFDKGTQIFINHATRTEESERPEGDWHKLVGALAVPAYYLENHKQGPGLFSKAAFAPDMAPTIKAKAPYSGMSIRANGDAVMEAGRAQMREGVPVLKKFTSAESVDIVTRAGAGGMILTEAARAANQQGENSMADNSMSAEESKLLRETVARLSNKETRREAIQEGARILRDVSLPDAAKEYIIETVLKESLPMKDGVLDTTKFAESVNNEAKRFGGAIGMGPRVTGMGAAPVVKIDEAQRKQIEDRQKSDEQSFTEAWADLLEEKPDASGKYKLAEVAVRGRAS